LEASQVSAALTVETVSSKMTSSSTQSKSEKMKSNDQKKLSKGSQEALSKSKKPPAKVLKFS
jgi:hypothetical protein